MEKLPNNPSEQEPRATSWSTLSPFNFRPSPSETPEKPHAELPKNISAQSLKEATPTEQVRLISELNHNAESNTTQPVVKSLTETLHTIDEFLTNNSPTPFVQILISHYKELLTERLSERSENDMVELLTEEDDSFWDFERKNLHSNLEFYLEDTDMDTYAQNLSTQEHLHQKYKTIPSYEPILEIAPDAAAVIDPYSAVSKDLNTLGAIHTTSGKIFSYREREEGQNTLSLDKDLTYLLDVAHNSRVEQLITEKLGLELSDIPLDSQIQLLKFMTNSDNDRFDKLCNTLNKLDPSLRLKLAESFLATDFGEDFGDSLLEIADSKLLTSEQIGSILDNIDSSRKSISDITNLFGEFHNKDFSKEYARSANERLTDAITVFREIAKSSHASADLGWFGKADFTYETALETLNYETTSLKIISQTMSDVKDGKDGAFAEKILTPSEYRNRTMYNFYSPDHGYVLLYTRPEGSGTFDQAIEYGKARSKYSEASKNAGVEASISFIVNPVNPHELPSPFRPNFQSLKNPNFYDPTTMDKVSAIRLDREGRAPNIPANDPSRDPINPIGTISVDLAAINDRADTPSGKIARLLSVGNKLRMGGNYSLNHNTNWFDQEKYGTSGGFKNLVNYLDSLAGIWCAKHPPAPSAQSFTSTAKVTKFPSRRAA